VIKFSRNLTWIDRLCDRIVKVPRILMGIQSTSLVIFDPGLVNFLLLGSGRVGSAIFGLGMDLKISPKNVKFFNILPFGSKKCHRVGSKITRVRAGSASYLPQVKSMSGSGQAPSLSKTLPCKGIDLMV